jgi:L-ornithine Nalpha-acyltransferase
MGESSRSLRAPGSSAGEKFRTLLQRAPLFRPLNTGLAPLQADILGRLGSLEVRLAAGPKEVRRAQRLRYKVFYEEGGATPDLASRWQRRDADAFDAICDHLLVLDHADSKRPDGKPKVVGTYRLLRQDIAERHSGFYSASEFDIGPLLARHPNTRFLELGRSCVLAPYRDKFTVNLLWHGIWAYVRRHRVDAMFGCASLEGTDLTRLALPLSFLHHHALSPEPWRVRAVASRRLPMDLLCADKTDAREAMRRLPPLLKGYLRVGATLGDGAVVDTQFGTTDVFVVMPVSCINTRYLDHFGPEAQRYAASFRASGMP